MTVAELCQKMNTAEFRAWMVYDEMIGIVRDVRTAFDKLSDEGVLDLIREEQAKKGWAGRIS